MLKMFFFFQAEDGIRDIGVTGVQTCALPISVLQRGCEQERLERRAGLPSRAAAVAADRVVHLRRAEVAAADHRDDAALDRKSVVQGKSVDLGGRRIIKKKKNRMTTSPT